MNVSYEFLAALVDTLTEHIAVIDREGRILFVNKSWCRFGQENNHANPNDWVGINYLQACDAKPVGGTGDGAQAAEGIRRIIDKEQSCFQLEYPCDSPTEKRWFLMRAVEFEINGDSFIVISHSNITERKLMEEQVVQLSRIDSLTGLANRRYFDEWYHGQWARSVREQTPLTIALIDIDHFKLLNDSLGHGAGDDCLKTVSIEMLSVARRPDDISVRYGGDELMIVYGNTEIEESLELLKEFVSRLGELAIPNPNAPTGPNVTVSIGVATTCPDKDDDPQELIRTADNLLYMAKDGGRNRIEVERRCEVRD
ncbi:MAG: sensor domain-containing diguanylate cyclase [Candidatus Thiodiazotropha sp.]